MKEMILLIPLLLDGFITNYINANSFFMPLLTITTIYTIYPVYKKKEKTYFTIIVILGILYDLLYTNLLFFNAIIFFLIGLLSRYICKNYTNNVYKQFVYIAVVIISYELLFATILFIYKIVPVPLSKAFYKITHSLLLNIIYGELLYLLLKTRKNKS